MFTFQCGDYGGRVGRRCLVGHGSFESGISNCLLPNTNISDTTPVEYTFTELGEDTVTKWKRYYVGWMMVREIKIQ